MHSHEASIPIDTDLRAIAKEILAMRKTQSDWAEIESDDLFQMGQWSGGYDAHELAFTFSYWDGDEREYWCVLKLSQMASIASGATNSVQLIHAE